MLRTHTCGQLRSQHIGEKVVLCGWLRSMRDHNHFAFIDLVDRYGRTQVYITEEQMQGLCKESLLQVHGVVQKRPEANPDIATGEIEVTCEKLEVLAPCTQELPFEIFDEIEAREEQRLEYRFLDIRRPVMLSRLQTRSRIASAFRSALEEIDFLEVETPMFVRSTPEGSRDFLVPSRTHHGKFYALPQSPQLYKQMLMIAGVDRYYQFARCFRDEDARRERQLVHTQVDMEMVTQDREDVFRAVEKAFARAFSRVFEIELPTPFPQYTYEEVIRRWGIDKPDLRFGMELVDFSDCVASCGFQIFEQTVAGGGVIKGLVAPGCANYSRKQVAQLEKFAQNYHAKGLMALKAKDGKLEGSIAKKMSDESVARLHQTSAAKDGDLVLLTAGESAVVHRALGELRNHLARELQLIAPNQYNFLWVIDFPLFEWDEEKKGWAPMHHMFSMPKPEYLDNFEQDPASVKGDLYDLVLNGVELGSGSLRITSPELQERVMKLIGMSHEEAQRRFGFLLDAYQYASPPHGGIGLGFDNLVMTMLGLTNIREVMAYPNASNGMFLYDDSPSTVEPEQIEELHIKIVEKEQKPEN